MRVFAEDKPLRQVNLTASISGEDPGGGPPGGGGRRPESVQTIVRRSSP